MTDKTNKNLAFWDQMKRPPTSALKLIKAGRLTGMSNISPQWRYQIMTEVFGMVGFGWKYTIDKKWTTPGANDEVFVFVEVTLYVKVNDVWSEPIPGSGGSKLIQKEKGGLHNNDEAFKMAETDAVGTAMARLGVGADIYLGTFDGSKYVEPVEFPKKANTPKEAESVVASMAESYNTTEGNVDSDFPPKSDAKTYVIDEKKNYPMELIKELKTLTQLQNVEIVQFLNNMEHGSYTAEQISIKIKETT